MRRPHATTVSAARMNAARPWRAWAARAFSWANLSACRRGNSPFFSRSSIAAGMTWAGTMPACASKASRRGLSLARTSSGLAEAIGDAPFGEVIRGHLDHHLVAGEHADAVLAHLARGMGDDLMAILQEDPEGGVG